MSFRGCDWLFPPSAREVSPGNRSNYKSTRQRVDSKGLYGRWRLHLMGSCQCSLLFFYPRSTFKFSRTHLKVFERSRSSCNLKVLVVDDRGKPCGVSEGKTTRKIRCTYVCTGCIASAPGGNRTQATVGTGECFHYGVNLLRRNKYGS